MILYHGTTLEKGKEIIKDGIIKSNIERNYADYGKIKNTTDSYVYLTINLYTANYYGNINLIGINDYEKKYVCIFKINIDDNVLLPDYDEIEVKTKSSHENMSAKKSLEKCGCVTVSNDVNINNSKYMILPGTWNPLENENVLKLCRDLSKLQLYGGDVGSITNKVQEQYDWQPVR